MCIRDSDLALHGVEEMFEALQHLKNWKTHRQTDIGGGFDRDEFLEEMVDAYNYFFALMINLDITEDEFKSILSVDVFGAFNVLKESFLILSKLGGGSIVQFLTTAVLKTLENDGMSGIPKTAVMGIVRQLAREVKDTNVRINAVAPGVIDAGIVHSSFTADKTAQEVIEMCLDRTPMPRMGKPNEVSELVKFLLDDNAGYINGQIIGVDGGYSA